MLFQDMINLLHYEHFAPYRQFVSVFSLNRTAILPGTFFHTVKISYFFVQQYIMQDLPNQQRKNMQILLL